MKHWILCRECGKDTCDQVGKTHCRACWKRLSNRLRKESDPAYREACLSYMRAHRTKNCRKVV